MTTRHASLATARSLIFEIAVTTVLFRPVSLTHPDPIRNPARSPLRVGAFEAIVCRPRTLEHVAIVDEITTANEAIWLEQHPAARLVPVRAHVVHVLVTLR